MAVASDETVRGLIRRALQLIGVVDSNSAVRASEATDAHRAMRDMLNAWSLERLLVLARTNDVFALTPGQQTYTLGVGGNFNTTRPIRIDQAWLRVGTADYPIEILDENQWAAITIKSTISAYPTKLWSDNAAPLMNISVWPVPSGSPSLVLYTWKPLAELSDLDAPLALPPGFARALRYNLAAEVAPEYGKTPSQHILDVAATSKGAIKSANPYRPLLATDPALASRGGYNIYTDS